MGSQVRTKQLVWRHCCSQCSTWSNFPLRFISFLHTVFLIMHIYLFVSDKKRREWNYFQKQCLLAQYGKMTFKEQSKLIFFPQKFHNMLLCNSTKEFCTDKILRLLLNIVNSVVWRSINLKFLFNNTPMYQLSMATKMLCNKKL